jgi:hypothetical protein
MYHAVIYASPSYDIIYDIMHDIKLFHLCPALTDYAAALAGADMLPRDTHIS